MTHAGLILFLFTFLLAAVSRLWLQVSKKRSSLPGTVDLRATAEEVSAVRSRDASTIMRVMVSLLVLLAALFIILSKQYDGDQQKWAFGAIGTVLGYWLKS